MDDGKLGMTLDDIIKMNKTTEQAQSEAGCSGVSKQRRGTGHNRVLGSFRGGYMARGTARNWMPNQKSQQQQLQAYRNRGRGFIIPRFMNRRGFGYSNRGANRFANPGTNRFVIRGGNRFVNRGGVRFANQKTSGFASRGGFQHFNQGGFGFVNRGGFGYRLPNYQSNRSNYAASEAAFSQMSGQAPYRHFNEGSEAGYIQHNLPVHQRLGWVTPAQRTARSSLRFASQFLNMRERSNQYVEHSGRGHYSSGNYAPGNRWAYKKQQQSQYQQKQRRANNARQNRAPSPTDSVISISFNNEMAMQQPQSTPYRKANRGGPKFLAPLSRQNVARLPGGSYSVAAGPSNKSYSYRSLSHSARNQENRAYRAQPQLRNGSRYAPSLSALRHQLDVPEDREGAMPPPQHRVKLDKAVQHEIRELQREKPVGTSLNSITPAEVYNGTACLGLLASRNTQTSINDRFGLLGSIGRRNAN